MNAKQINFAFRVRHALNEHLDTLPAATTDRLAAARAQALARKKADTPRRATAISTAFAGGGGSLFGDRLSWLARMGIAIPMLVVAAGIFALYQAEYEQRISDVAEMDAMVLADELPLNAYLDNGFNAYLANRPD